ncbi:hypothetical protein CCACVL1_06018 [Corchorus capsularis]|uniref:Uncharacterized protein n=1 Tax=Corchorus capsularis TaxID=210143 RepID=A0A1R3JHU6_COCAP|nr:hypothetical protein CCACVL1_06018 [Corchorus capsularis]
MEEAASGVASSSDNIRTDFPMALAILLDQI